MTLRVIEDRPCLEWMGGDLCMRRARGITHEHERQGRAFECIAGWSYCDAHGGVARARQEAEADFARCWLTLAPPTLSADRVLAAGAMGLSSEHSYVVIRPNEGRWKCALGIWGHTREMPGSYARMLDAERAGIRWWRREVADRVALIRSARGGTLDWGAPVKPAPNPLVLVARERGPQPPPDMARDPLPEALEAGPLVVGTNARQRRALVAARAGEEVYRKELDILSEFFSRVSEIARLPEAARGREAELLGKLSDGTDDEAEDAIVPLEDLYRDHGVKIDA